MIQRKISPSYVVIMDMLFNTPTIEGNVIINDINGTSFKRGAVANLKNIRLDRDFIIINKELGSMCTPAQWNLVNIIQRELKMYNVLWECKPEIKNNGNYCKAIKGFIEMKVLIKTETTNIYIVNPYYISYGEYFAVLSTTAAMLFRTNRIRPDLITDKQPVKEINLITNEN